MLDNIEKCAACFHAIPGQASVYDGIGFLFLLFQAANNTQAILPIFHYCWPTTHRRHHLYSFHYWSVKATPAALVSKMMPLPVMLKIMICNDKYHLYC